MREVASMEGEKIAIDEARVAEALRNFMELPEEKRIVEFNRMGLRLEQLQRDSMEETDPDRKSLIDKEVAMYEAILEKIRNSGIFKTSFEQR